MNKLFDIAGGPSAIHTVIDVGANDGGDSLPYARLYPAIRFVAVEPTPDLARRLEAESIGLANYTVVQCAIGRADGEALFNLRRFDVHNSLAAIDEENVTGVGIPVEMYEVHSQVSVRVRTLESLCDELMIEAIDVLHVDAQGSDMDVLKSAGRMLETVRAGVVEVGRRVNLYSNSVSRRELVHFLTINGLRIVSINANDQWNYEQNVFFARSRSGRASHLSAFVKMMLADLAHVTGRVRSRVALRTRIRNAIRQT